MKGIDEEIATDDDDGNRLTADVGTGLWWIWWVGFGEIG